ncbi:serine/threonine-protein kinase [Lyngbya sp. CCY1209]|uniref:serine/threonine-protein kinase n=1 Tax=Lyngbya sp. CCY1209 TaxID=2886103 RepID=UPI002D20F9E2|nr:serine/threonine-protein kinase [Lyngbya sp. CCY1209]MEB3884835.1 serine/threonine-protein kinase [Lyngbya sp. CCY1209]
MSYCTNPACPNPENPNEALKCQACGSRLRLKNRYLVLKPLGKGGFGATFLARDLSLPGYPTCVVKQLRPTANSKRVLEMARQLFQREAKTLGKIGDHPQIPRLLDYFVGKQQFYLVQEFIDGSTLKQEIRSRGPYTEEQTKDFLREILSVLDYIHSQEVIHRDIKPANILRRRQDNRLVLIDFGAVKDKVTQATMMGTGETAFTNFAIGTSGFAPIEQMSLRPVYASDVYAVGMTCVYLLTGKSPSALEHDPTTGEVHWREHTDVSDSFALILQRMLAVSVYQRYQSAQDVLSALDNESDFEDLSGSMAVQTPLPETPEDPTIYNEDQTSVVLSPRQQEAQLIRARRERQRQPDITQIIDSRMPVAGGLSASQGAPAAMVDGTVLRTRGTQESRQWNESSFRAAYRKGQRDFGDCELSGLNLEGGTWKGTNFYEARLARVNFQGADLRDANFGRARLVQANLRKANLQNAYLSTANLEAADLRGANLSGACLSRANLRGTNLCGANLKGAIVGDEQLGMARTNWRTILPNGKRGFGL